jgi:hypothetical protein
LTSDACSGAPRTGRRRGGPHRERGATAPLAALLVAALVGAAGGFVLERTGVVDPLGEPPPAVVRIDVVDVHDCPDGTVVASLARGDRVLATAESTDGDWVEIRSPLGLDQRAWVRQEVLEGDPAAGRQGDLPRRDCQTVPPSSTSTSTSTSTSSTTTSSTSSTTTTSTTVPTTTTAPPNAGPLIAGLAVTGRTSTLPPGTTSSTVPGGSTLPPAGPYQYVHALPPSGTPVCPETEATVTVQVADPDGLASVVVTWDTGPGGSRGEVFPAEPTAPSISWVGSFSFPDTALPLEEEFRLPTFTVTARDNRGATSTLTVAPPTSTFRVYGADDLPCDR